MSVLRRENFSCFKTKSQAIVGAQTARECARNQGMSTSREAAVLSPWNTASAISGDIIQIYGDVSTPSTVYVALSWLLKSHIVAIEIVEFSASRNF